VHSLRCKFGEQSLQEMTIRFKLTMMAIAGILVANSVLSLVIVAYLGRVWLGEVQTRVGRNLNAARARYDARGERISFFLQAVASDESIPGKVRQKKHAELARMLQNLYGSSDLDFLSMLDGTGRVLCRARDPGQRGDDLSGSPLVAAVLRSRKGQAGTIIVPADALAAEGQDLAVRARFEVLPTLASRPTRETVRADGMVMAAAVPVLDEQGELAAVLYAGYLLNRRDEIVDAIKQQVYPQEVYQGKDIGTVTIFQDDLRIATNVRMEDGSRAVGTLLSAAVADEVLVRGGTWAAPAFVVNDWYITAYGPIRDPTGRIIGCLYVGLLQAPFLHRLYAITGVFLATVFGATLVSLGLTFAVTRFVLQPISSIVAMQDRIVAGDLTARVGIRPSGEMGRLCEAIDKMADAVAEREEKLQDATRRQIGRSAQLASVGRLAAGVAHEINNPLTTVLALTSLLRNKKEIDEQDREDLDLVIRETRRAAEIVRGLLDFARESPSVKAPLNINELIRQTVRLLGNREAFQHIRIVGDFAENLPLIEGDGNKLQQVLLNLSLNACEAMPNGGTLQLSTSVNDEKVCIRVADTGCGIRREHLDKLFEPFFTTKAVGKGVGLGLSVSYGIIQQHGGTLEVQSEEGKGTTFTILLPVESGPPAGKESSTSGPNQVAPPR
jgi:two-component system NtrC family sensor kinase